LVKIRPETAPIIYAKKKAITNATYYGPDSLFFPSFMKDRLGLEHEEVFKQLTSLAPWVDRNNKEMKYRGNSLNRTKFFLIADTDDKDEEGRPSIYPRYSYPGFQYESFKNYKTFETLPVVNNIVEKFQNDVTFKLPNEKIKSVKINHVIGTRYSSGEDYIGFHDDKMKDIAKDSLILLLSMGERREMHLQDKEGNLLNWFVMEPGSLFILGPKTNATMRHSLVKVSDEKIIKRAPNAPLGVRVSLVLRHITTEFKRDFVLKKIKKAQEKKKKDEAKAQELKRKREEETTETQQKQPSKKRKVTPPVTSGEPTKKSWLGTPVIKKKGKGKLHSKECAGVKVGKTSWSSYVPVVVNSGSYTLCQYCLKQ